MLAGSRKRIREAAIATSAALASRVDHTTPTWWHRVASAAGVTGADAFLVHLGRSIAVAQGSLADAAELARAQLQTTRSALHVAIDIRCDELSARIDSAEASKAASLERELVAVDAALERWRTESGAVREALSSLRDADLEAQHAALSSRVDALDAQLQALPTCLVEPPVVALLADARVLLLSIADMGHVVAPLPISASDVTLERMPNSIRYGDSLRLRLILGPRHVAQSVEELELSLGMLAEATQVEATLECFGVEPNHLLPKFESDAAQRCLQLHFDAPLSLPVGSSVGILAVSVAGAPVMGLPLSIPARRGVSAPLLLILPESYASAPPCISPDGRVYCFGFGTGILVFDEDGSPLPGLPIKDLGLSPCIYNAAFVDTAVPTLLFLDTQSRLVALDPATRAIRWSFEGDHHYDSDELENLAVFPSLGVVLIFWRGSACVYRLSDGSRLGKVDFPGLTIFMGSDPATGTVYGDIWTEDDGDVATFFQSWSYDAIGIVQHGPVLAAKAGRGGRPFAIMPPVPGKAVSHLIVGQNRNDEELIVLALPSLTLVHTHVMKGLHVTGLAADPWGGALAVCDDWADAIHVLAWPLPGMSSLE